MAKKRVMSGMRATGQLHIGHYLGVLVNWLQMQDQYDCFFAVADWHMLTTGFAKTEGLRENTRQLVLDYLAAGVDPAKATIYVQSSILETAELHLILSMITPVNWLQRDPTLKEMVRELHLAEDHVSYGLLGYPALQTADILGPMGELVPVGEDQMAHIEISRDIARRFNHLFGVDLFPEPQGLLTPTPVVFGTDGRKMSKSYGNDLKLADDEKSINSKVMSMVTDPARLRKDDPGHPEVCMIYNGWETYASEKAPEIATLCRAGEIGCVQCKRNLAVQVNERLAPIQARRRELETDPGMLDDIVIAGNARARQATQETLAKVRDAMHLNQPYNRT
ncbi:MAG: tryptophanyl-tRNA synthetase [Cyanobacteria bacterium RYN_339]|nr:tryptophanyl-tRNA synthetase [Cyanobacteria bacterium RYN_339]